MNVKFSFDKTAAMQRGCTMKNVHRTIKSLLAAYDLPCVSDDDTLTFKDRGQGDDFAIMWDIILSLLRSEWFMDCAVSCVWQDEDGEEDVLALAGKMRDVVRQ